MKNSLRTYSKKLFAKTVTLWKRKGACKDMKLAKSYGDYLWWYSTVKTCTGFLLTNILKLIILLYNVFLTGKYIEIKKYYTHKL